MDLWKVAALLHNAEAAKKLAEAINKFDKTFYINFLQKQI